MNTYSESRGYVGESVFPRPGDKREIKVGEEVILSDERRGKVWDVEVGSHVLGYHVELEDGTRVRVRPDNLVPVLDP